MDDPIRELKNLMEAAESDDMERVIASSFVSRLIQIGECDITRAVQALIDEWGA